MTFYEPALDFDLSCYPVPIEFSRGVPAFASSGPEQGYVGGQAIYERQTEAIKFRLSPITRALVDDMIYTYRLSGAGTRWMWFRAPGDREPVEARFTGPLEIDQRGATVLAVSVDLEVRT